MGNTNGGHTYPFFFDGTVRKVFSCGHTQMEAIAQLESTAIDMLFTDVVMPGSIDGYELARLARDRWPELNVILTSGFAAWFFGSTVSWFRILRSPQFSQSGFSSFEPRRSSDITT